MQNNLLDLLFDRNRPTLVALDLPVKLALNNVQCLLNLYFDVLLTLNQWIMDERVKEADDVLGILS
jgi:hypothetical protein